MSPTHEDSSDHFGESEDPNDDSQLVIRIPNPKVYMARQSRWVGRRGKPRCDHCRLTNLKCDRVLPICNHCSWANYEECKYTPLPTPAHRGIPRCDRCRKYNMKCDRNLPICNNCSECPEGIVCNYTPKKKQKGKEDGDPQLSATMGEGSSQKKKSWQADATAHQQIMKMESGPEDITSHTFYGQNVASTHGQHGGLSPTHSYSESTSDVDSGQTGRFSAVLSTPNQTLPTYSMPSDIASPSSTPNLPIIPHAFSKASPPNFLVSSTRVEPWRHPAFIPLPDYVYHCLMQMDTIELPKREQFEDCMLDFLDTLMDPLRETAVFPAEKYKKAVRALKTGDMSQLSDHLRFWLSIHRIRSGTDKYNVLLIPRDSVFEMDAVTASNHRRQFVADLLNRNTDIEHLQAHHYDRIPVLQEIYDILTYAHRGHRPVAQMLLEIVRLRFATVTWPMAEMYVRMCPLCIRLQKSDSLTHQSSPSTSPSP